MRECFKIRLVPCWKLTARGNFCDSWTTTSFKVIWQFYTTLKASLFLIGSLLHPLRPFVSRINASTFFVSVFFAQVTTKSLFPLPIHLFTPLILYPYWVFVTVVLIFEASEPILSSVKPHPPNISRLMILGKYFFFCSSLLKAYIVNPRRTNCTIAIVEKPASPRANSAIMTPWSN